MNYDQFINVMGYSSMTPAIFTLLFLLAIWSVVWKGLALWKAARVGSKPWFIALLVINTMGILEIIYVFFLSKKKKDIV